MKPFLLIAFIFFIGSSASAQSKHALEIFGVARYDRHSKYISNYGGRAYNDTTSLFGFNYGAGLAYQRHITGTIAASIGVGYYRLRIDKIKGNMPFGSPGTRTARNINYDDGSTNLLYATTNYYYDNITLNLRVVKIVKIKENFQFTPAIEFVRYFGFSQRYDLGNGKYYHTENTRPVAFGINLDAGIRQQYKYFYLNPSLLMPVFQRLGGDRNFYEEPDVKVDKWFAGIGISLRIGKEL